MIKSKTYYLLFLLIFHVVGMPVLANQIKVEKLYTQEQGLVFDLLNDIIKDEQGFLWIGTKNGLSRFDGYEFINYNQYDRDTAAIIGNDVSALFLNDNKVYVGTWLNGLCSYEKGTNSFLEISKQKNSLPLQILFIDSLDKDKLIIGTKAKGIFVYHKSSATLQKLSLHTKNYCASYCPISKNRIAIGHWDGVSIFEIDEKGFHVERKIKVAQNISNIIKKDHTLFITSNEGLHAYDLTTQTLTKVISLNVTVNSIYLDESLLWLGTMDGLKLYDLQSFRLESSLEGYNVIQVIKGKEGFYWVATKSGLLKVSLHGNNATLLFPDKKVRSMIRTHASWFIDTKSGVYTFDNIEKPILTKVINDFRFSRTNFAFFDNHTLAIAEGSQLLYEYNETKTFKSFELDDRVLWLCSDQEHSQIWCLTTKNLIKLSLTGNQISEERFPLPYTLLFHQNCSLVKTKHSLWVSAKGKQLIQFVIDEKRFENYAQSYVVEHIGEISDIAAQGDSLYFATRKGIRLFGVAEDSLHDMNNIIEESSWVTNIYFESGGKLFYTTYNTVYAYNLKNNIKTKLYKISKFEEPFNEKIQLLHYKEKVYLNKRHSHCIAIPYIHDARVQKHDIKAPMITRFLVNDHRIYDLNKKHSFTHTQHNISVGISDIDPERIREGYFLYKLEKDHLGEWQKTTDRRLNFSNLSDGDYHLSIKKVIGNDVGELRQLSFEIRPPIWRSTYAYIAYVTVLFLAFLLTLYIQKKRQERKNWIKQESIKIEEEKKYNNLRWRLFTDLSHEIKTPLTLIAGPIKDALASGDLKKDLNRDTLKLVARNTDRLKKLVSQLLDFRKVENDLIQLFPLSSDVISFMLYLKESFHSLAEKYGLTYEFESSHEHFLAYYDKEILERIVTNLISNAFKYTPKGGTVVLSISIDEAKNNELTISVKDTGVGIDASLKDKVFNRFQAGEQIYADREASTGLGLSLVKELVSLHKGSIQFESKVGMGSTFFVTIPTDKLAYQDVVETTQEDDKLVSLDSTTKVRMLIVEDNVDLREYMLNIFKDKYDVTMASNGSKGFILAKELIPDIIISDVMMPQMDGYEFCKLLKNDKLTDRIPIILLTAKGMVEDKIEGLNLGADDFMFKPFDSHELSIRVENILENRMKLRASFQQTMTLKDNKLLSRPSIEDQFLTELQQFVIENIENQGFGPLTLCNLLGLSKTQLYRKTNDVLGMSPGEYIKKIRLATAAELITNKKATISDVAYMVGFSSVSYFSTNFKNEFGMSPREYSKKK